MEHIIGIVSKTKLPIKGNEDGIIVFVSTFHVTATPALTTQPSVILKNEMYCRSILEVWVEFKCTGSQIDW